MERKDTYLIGDRFIVERNKREWFVRDLGGKLHKIFDEEPILVKHIQAYKSDDVYWILGDAPLGSSKEGRGAVVIKGNEIVSYSVLEKNKLYIRHYGQEFKGRIKVGKRREILIDRNNIEVRKEGGDSVYLTYAFLGKRLTPVIKVGSIRSRVACFPELNKVYSGQLCIEDAWGCVNVWIFKNEMMCLYVLFENGEDFLVYEGPSINRSAYYFPKVNGIENIVVVYFHGPENVIANNLRRIPGFAYLYVKQDCEEDVYISFNLKEWKKLAKAAKMIFKGGGGEIGENALSFKIYLYEKALEKFAKKPSDHQELLPSPSF